MVISFLVGTNSGDIALWDVGTRVRLIQRSFKVRDLAQCSVALQVYTLPSFNLSL